MNSRYRFNYDQNKRILGRWIPKPDFEEAQRQTKHYCDHCSLPCTVRFKFWQRIRVSKVVVVVMLFVCFVVDDSQIMRDSLKILKMYLSMHSRNTSSSHQVVFYRIHRFPCLVLTSFTIYPSNKIGILVYLNNFMR